MLHRIDEKDNVAVALDETETNETIFCCNKTLIANEKIPKGHKMAISSIEVGEPVIKYGNQIGLASSKITAGDWVHTHNVASQADSHRKYSYHYDDSAILPGISDKTFMGYDRKNGFAGTRNYIVLISGSFCTNTHLTAFARQAETFYPKNERFDGFLPLTHECGCGQMGQDLINTRRTVASLMQNPNVGGVLFVELGCENNLFDTIEPYLEQFDYDRFRKIHLQSEEDEYSKAMLLMGELYSIVQKDQRVPINLSKLHIAVNCGGSDGFSGLTGNRLAGKLTDRFVGKYGSTVNITEVPEMFGAEHILMNRAKDEATFKKVVELIEGFKEYIEKYGASASGNPSFGNKLGGISTIEDKSLGCIQKGGRCAVTDVIPYGHMAKENGFNLVWGPGSDLVGVTAQIAAGATIVLFVTGRGTRLHSPRLL
jgi:altronate hydrolase